MQRWAKGRLKKRVSFRDRALPQGVHVPHPLTFALRILHEVFLTLRRGKRCRGRASALTKRSRTNDGPQIKSTGRGGPLDDHLAPRLAQGEGGR